MTVLLGYIDHCITSKNIMPTFYYAVIMINALTQAPNHTENNYQCEAINYAFFY